MRPMCVQEHHVKILKMPLIALNMNRVMSTEQCGVTETSSQTRAKAMKIHVVDLDHVRRMMIDLTDRNPGRTLKGHVISGNVMTTGQGQGKIIWVRLIVQDPDKIMMIHMRDHGHDRIMMIHVIVRDQDRAMVMHVIGLDQDRVMMMIHGIPQYQDMAMMIHGIARDQDRVMMIRGILLDQDRATMIRGIARDQGRATMIHGKDHQGRAATRIVMTTHGKAIQMMDTHVEETSGDMAT